MQPHNHFRSTILKYQLLDNIHALNLSERDIAIIRRYVAGESQTTLAHAYKISGSAIHSILYRFCRCSLKYHASVRDKSG